MKQWGICMAGNEIAISKALLEVIEQSQGEFHYVEIGVAEGQTFSAVCSLLDIFLAEWLAIAVDIENGYSLNERKFKKNCEPFGGKIFLDLDGSPKALRRLLFANVILIDGNHSFNSVLKDFEASANILKEGGLIIFHDADEDCQGADISMAQPDGIEVRKAIEFILNSSSIGVKFKKVLETKGDKKFHGRGIIILKRS
jgi:hypothetical protein